eukprot:jgi/Phyca11/547368/estExt2_Genewise1Plus.C_PHYCAscaffold_240383
MWMQNSVGGGSGNFHDRNRFGSQYAQSSYSGGASHDAAGDWKSKILESGQWLGGKVIEYGGKLARGPNTDSIPDHYGQQMPRNDGRANWMADIRSSSSGGGSGGYNGGYNGSGGYQNDFATERPKAYSEYNRGYPPTNANPGGYEPKSLSSTNHHHHHHKTRHAKKKSDGKKSKKSKKKQQSESESDSEEQSEELSISESSETESADDRHHKSKSKKKKNKAKKHSGFYSESESDEEDTKKASKNYSFSFDPSKLPPPPAEEDKGSSKKSKSKKSKKEKTGKKSRTRRQSVASTDDESASEKESTRAKSKKRGSKKAAAASATVDLLGVDLDAQPAAQTAATGPAQETQPSIFDAPQNQNPLQDLAGLSFSAPVQTTAPTQPSVFDATVASNESQTPPQQQADTFRTNLLPENNIVDLSSLASEKKKSLSANPEEKRTLNDLQKARGGDQQAPVMPMPMQGQQQMQQNMPGGMMQLSMTMNQLQLTDGSAQMYPNMQMQQMPMQGLVQQMQPQMMMMQPHMGMMAQPQMMNMPMMQQQQQQLAQGGAAMAQSAGAQQTLQGMTSGAHNSNSSDPFSQVNMM